MKSHMPAASCDVGASQEANRICWWMLSLNGSVSANLHERNRELCQHWWLRGTLWEHVDFLTSCRVNVICKHKHRVWPEVTQDQPETGCDRRRRRGWDTSAEQTWKGWCSVCEAAGAQLWDVALINIFGEGLSCGVSRGIHDLWGRWCGRYLRGNILYCRLNVHQSGSTVVKREEGSGHVLHGADEGDGSEAEQSCRFLFQMVRVSSQTQSFLFLLTSIYLVIS